MPSERTTNLRQIRKQNGLTQEQVAGYLGVSPATYSSWETGRSQLGADRIVDLCDFFGCTPNDILDYHRSSRGFAALPKEEEQLLALYRAAAPNIRKALMELIGGNVKGSRLH